MRLIHGKLNIQYNVNVRKIQTFLYEAEKLGKGEVLASPSPVLRRVQKSLYFVFILQLTLYKI